jgi:hypothetical protein
LEEIKSKLSNLVQNRGYGTDLLQGLKGMFSGNKMGLFSRNGELKKGFYRMRESIFLSLLLGFENSE